MYQQIVLIGHLGKDPNPRMTPSGASVTTFPLATSKTFKSDSGEVITQTIWWSISTFGKLAENCSAFLQKGSKVMVVGEVKGDEKGHPRMWTGSDNAVHASFEVTAGKVIFLSPKDEAKAAVEVPASEDDAVPF
jgi:single-strand DNA-binding protein